MFTRIAYGRRNGAYNYSEFILDTNADLESLPTSVASGSSGNNIYNACAVGSRAYVTETRKSYILNNANQWKMMSDYTATGGGAGTGFSVIDDGDGNVSII